MEFNEANSPFNILGVSENCSDAEVKQAYRRMAMRYHPDRNKGEAAEEEFKRVQLAYQMIRNPASRAFLRSILKTTRARASSRYQQPPHPTHYGPGTTQAPAGQKEYRSRAAQVQTQRQTVGSTIWLQILLFFSLRLYPTRLPLHAIVLIPPAWYFVALTSQTVTLTMEEIHRGLGIGFLTAIFSDEIMQRMRFAHRYILRARLNNLIGYVLIFATAGLIGSIDFGGVAILPVLFEMEAEYFRAILWLILGSATYLWFVYVLLFQKYSVVFDTIFMWFWLIALQYNYLVVF